MSCGVGHRHDLDPKLLYLWCRLAAAAPIRPLAWELPYATGVVLKKKKKKKMYYRTKKMVDLIWQAGCSLLTLVFAV